MMINTSDAYWVNGFISVKKPGEEIIIVPFILHTQTGWVNIN